MLWDLHFEGGRSARMKEEAARRREELERQKDELRAIEEERAHKKWWRYVQICADYIKIILIHYIYIYILNEMERM